MVKLSKALLQKIGIDGAIAFTLLTRIVQTAGALGVIVVIARFLTGDLQGYYYTFASIIAIQVFFELGLSGIITQFAAHEFAKLEVTSNFDISGHPESLSRLSSLLRFCVKWFAIVAVGLFFFLSGVGFFFFTNYNGKVTQEVNWQIPWIFLSLATSLNLLVDPILAFLDGVGRIKQMAKIRLIQKSVNVILLFVFLILDFKLYASAVASFFAVLVIYIIVLSSSEFKLLKSIWLKIGQWKVNYLEEIFPYQWRIALSWISGYFIFQLFNPVLFATDGPVVAGQMGMTIQVLNGISLLSMSWMTTKVPVYSALIASKNYKELDALFNKTLKNLTIVNSALLLCFLSGVFVLEYFNMPLRLRLLPTFPLLCMVLTNILNQFIFSWATYLRCHKKEPLFVQAIISAIYCSITTIVFGKLYGLKGIVLPYTLWTVISVIWIHNIFRNKKEVWHQE